MSNGLRTEISKSIGTEDTWSRMFFLRGKFQIDITGVTDSIVRLQRTRDGGETWNDVTSFNEDVFYVGEVAGTRCQYRIGIAENELGTDETVQIYVEA